VTRQRFVHPEKHESEILSIDRGMQIDPSDEQLQNADLPRSDTLQPSSNVTLQRFVHPEKHEFEIISIDEGIQIAFSDEHSQNADSPRSETLQPR
jgi:anti-sigma regulatory factor (Ser/Thr protein kinase)